MFLPKDPLQRFIELFEALNADRSWLTDVTPLRFAAMTAITCQGEPKRVARSLQKLAGELKQRSGWFGELTGPLRFLVAAVLLQNDDSPQQFLDAVEQTRKLFRSHKVRRGGALEVIAALVLRGPEKANVSGRDVQRFQAIHAEMKRRHWWLTGTDDYPACAILARQKGSPAAIGQEVEQIYQELRSVGFKQGNPLQQAANLLYLAKEKPHLIATRYHDLCEAFRNEKTRIWQSEYDELAILSFLKLSAPRVVKPVQQYQNEIAALRPRPGRSMAFNLASSVAFIELVQSQSSAGVAEAKAMIDLQTILTAQQATVIAATTAATTSAAAHSS